MTEMKRSDVQLCVNCASHVTLKFLFVRNFSHGILLRGRAAGERGGLALELVVTEFVKEDFDCRFEETTDSEELD